MQAVDQLTDFDVPAGKAIDTLREAARQADVSFIYSVRIVRGVETKAVFGRYSPEQAFEIMLEDTSLAVFWHEYSGAFAIKKVPEKQSKTDSQTQNMKNLIEKLKKANKALLPATVAAVASPVFAQDDGEEELFQLSPFVVEAVEGTYSATSTLAGTRIRTDVADIGSSISILTEQLMQDTGATDAGSILNLVPNVEVAGELGNFSNAGVSGNTYQAQGARINPQFAQRVRGLVGAQLTRNYFQTIIPFDTYNTSQVTVNRGPNSVLFGLGSAGGVIENSMNTPAGVDSTTLSARFDQYGGHREVVDVSRVFADDRFKLRVSLMNEDKRFRQEEAFEEDRRGYLAWDWKIREAESDALFGDTSFRGYFEAGEIDKNPPDVIPPSVNYPFWFDISDYQQVVGNYPGIDSLDDVDGDRKTVAQGGDWLPKALIDNTDRSTLNDTPDRTPSFIHLVDIYGAADADGPGIFELDGFMTRARWGGSRGTQDFKFTSGDWELSGFSAPTLMNRDVFDFVNHLYTGDTDDISEDFDVKEFSLEQELFGGNMGVELSFNKQSFDRSQFTPYSGGRGRRIYLDISEFVTISEDLPSPAGDGAPPMRANPNVGRPVLQVNSIERNFFERDLETFRGTAFFKHDLNDSLGEKWGKWLGSHTLSAMYQDFSDTDKSLRETMNWESDEVDVGASNILNHRYNDFRRKTNAFVYIGDSALSASGPEGVRIDQPLSKSVVPVEGATGTYAYWDHSARQIMTTTAYGVFIPDVNGSNILQQDVESEAFILQSRWLDEHLITLFARRTDSVSNFEMIEEGNDRLADGRFNLAAHVLEDTPAFEQDGETDTKSFVLKFPEKYLFELPFDMDLRLHYFESETFEPSGLARRLDGSVIDNPNGMTEEYGFSFDLFDRRLSVTVNWYETSSNDARVGTALSAIENWIGSESEWARRAAEFEQDGGAVTDILDFSDPSSPVPQTTFSTWDEYFAAIFSVAPEPFATLTNPSVDRSTAVVTGTEIEGLNSTFDFVSEGMELELAGAITDNWNIVFNVAQQETVRSNTLPGVLEFAEEVESRLISSGLANLQDSPNLGEPNVFGRRWERDVLFPIRSEQAQDGQKSAEQREWRWNLVSSYRFTEGVLKGWTVGGVARWQDEAAIGYPVIFNEDGNLVNDVANPYFGPDEFNADFWVRHERTIFEDVDWSIQLNVRNAIGGDSGEFIPISIDPLGNIQGVRTSPERQIFLTNTFRF